MKSRDPYCYQCTALTGRKVIDNKRHGDNRAASVTAAQQSCGRQVDAGHRCVSGHHQNHLSSHGAVKGHWGRQTTRQEPVRPAPHPPQTTVQTGGRFVVLTHFAKKALSSMPAAVDARTALLVDTRLPAIDSVAGTDVTAVIFLGVLSGVALSAALWVV